MTLLGLSETLPATDLKKEPHSTHTQTYDEKSAMLWKESLFRAPLYHLHLRREDSHAIYVVVHEEKYALLCWEESDILTPGFIFRLSFGVWWLYRGYTYKHYPQPSMKLYQNICD